MVAIAVLTFRLVQCSIYSHLSIVIFLSHSDKRNKPLMTQFGLHEFVFICRRSENHVGSVTGRSDEIVGHNWHARNHCWDHTNRFCV